jgi:hypothetical protein
MAPPDASSGDLGLMANGASPQPSVSDGRF